MSVNRKSFHKINNNSKEKNLNRNMSQNFMPIYFNEKYKLNKKKLKMKKNAMDPVNFEEERKNDPKYKTELCKSFMETNFCVYGNKCRFAHGYKELVIKKQINHYKQKQCNSFFNKGYCPYGIRCNFKHDERKLEQIRLPYYYSHLISLHLPQLKTCRRLNVFQDISLMQKEPEKQINKNEIEKETEKENENNVELNKINEEEEDDKEKEKFSNSFSSENSSQATTSVNDSPIKENEKDFDFSKITDFFLQDLNFELDFFSHEN